VVRTGSTIGEGVRCDGRRAGPGVKLNARMSLMGAGRYWRARAASPRANSSSARPGGSDRGPRRAVWQREGAESSSVGRWGAAGGHTDMAGASCGLVGAVFGLGQGTHGAGAGVNCLKQTTRLAQPPCEENPAATPDEGSRTHTRGR
jgi:hypothetical protein